MQKARLQAVCKKFLGLKDWSQRGDKKIIASNKSDTGPTYRWPFIRIPSLPWWHLECRPSFYHYRWFRHLERHCCLGSDAKNVHAAEGMAVLSDFSPPSFSLPDRLDRRLKASTNNYSCLWGHCSVLAPSCYKSIITVCACVCSINIISSHIGQLQMKHRYYRNCAVVATI